MLSVGSRSRARQPAYWTQNRQRAGISRIVDDMATRDRMQRKIRGERGASDNPLRAARVLGVERVENDELWLRYQNSIQRLQGAPKRSRRSDGASYMYHEDECYLFFCTAYENIHAVTTIGIDVDGDAQNQLFAKSASILHQHAGFVESEEECGRVYCMLYCRAVLQAAQSPQTTSTTNGARAEDGDAGRKRKRNASSEAELAQPLAVYPEYVLYYRMDSADEEARAKEELRQRQQEEEAEGSEDDDGDDAENDLLLIQLMAEGMMRDVRRSIEITQRMHSRVRATTEALARAEGQMEQWRQLWGEFVGLMVGDAAMRRSLAALLQTEAGERLLVAFEEAESAGTGAGTQAEIQQAGGDAAQPQALLLQLPPPMPMPTPPPPSMSPPASVAGRDRARAHRP